MVDYSNQVLGNLEITKVMTMKQTIKVALIFTALITAAVEAVYIKQNNAYDPLQLVRSGQLNSRSTSTTGTPISCKEIKDSNSGSTSGTYQISPDGGTPFDVYCDMDTDGGGWTLVIGPGLKFGNSSSFWDGTLNSSESFEYGGTTYNSGNSERVIGSLQFDELMLNFDSMGTHGFNSPNIYRSSETSTFSEKKSNLTSWSKVNGELDNLTWNGSDSDGYTYSHYLLGVRGNVSGYGDYYHWFIGGSSYPNGSGFGTTYQWVGEDTYDCGNPSSGCSSVTDIFHHAIGLSRHREARDDENYAMFIREESLPNQPPTVSFTATPNPVTASQTITLDGSGSTDSDGTIVSYQWSLVGPVNGTQTASGQTASFTFGSADTITITLTATDDDGATASTSQSVTIIANVVPTASFTSSTPSGTAPLTITLDASGSTDSDGTIASYRWTTSDGQAATESTTSFTFSSAGEYVITLSVTDDTGATSSTTTTVTTTEPQLAVASFTATPTTGSAPLTVALDGSGSATPNESIIAYQWGSSDGQTATGNTTSLTFDEVGTYTITHTIIDSSAQTASTTQEITVTEPLAATITATPTTGSAPLTVSLDASGSTTPNSSIIAYNWSSSDSQNDIGSTASLTYDSAGEYTITLTIIDNEGNTATATETISVESGDEEADPLGYNTTARLSPQVIAAGISPTQVDYSDDEFDIVALVRPGILSIDRVTFRDSATSAFALQMTPAGILENGDELYKTTFSFQRGSFGDLVMASAWGPESGQYNIVAFDAAEQRSHQFPELMFGSNIAQTAATQQTVTPSYNSTKRLGPQVLIAGFSPSKIDVSDTTFDIIAIIRDGALTLDTVTVTQNQSPFELAMSSAGTLGNGDKAYKMSYTFQRNAFGTATLNTLWGDQPGQFNIHAVDSAQQRSHDFPDIMFGNFPAQ